MENTTNDAGKVSIKLPPRFELSSIQGFRKSYSSALSDVAIKRIEVDFSAVEFIDSSALGSLLVLHERAQKANQVVTLNNCQPKVMKILKVANFHRFFTTD
jgi:anti-anti-sigma factor